MAAGPQHPKQLAHQPVFVGLADADVAGGLQVDDRVEGAVWELERARVASPNADAIGEALGGYQLASLTHLLAADVHARDPAAVPAGDAQRRRADAAAHIQHALSLLEARQPGHQVGLGSERLAQALAALSEVAEMEAVAVEQPPLVGDQVEVRAHAPSGTPAAHQGRQSHPHRRPQLARTARRTRLPPRRHQHPCGHLCASS